MSEEDLIGLYKKRDALAQENADTSDITKLINENWVVKEKKPIILTKSYYANPELYPKYDNYDAINVDRCEDIPYDYEGIMGVPITFLSMRDRIYIPVDDTSLNTISSSVPKMQRNSKILHLFPCTQFEIIGLDRYVEDNPHYGHRFTIKGKETYARILIKKLS